MEQKKQIDSGQNLLGEIKDKIALYNEMYPDLQVELIEKIDVTNIVVGIYNLNKIDLFKRIPYDSQNDFAFLGAKYKEGIIYDGFFTDSVGIKVYREDFFETDFWVYNGTKINFKNGRKYCYIDEIINYEDMRLLMYQDGLIGEYEMGKATFDEMKAVLNYAYEYYNLGKKGLEKKKKIIEIKKYLD